MERLSTVALCLCGTIYCAVPVVGAQTPYSFSIRLEATQVLVAAYVFYKDRMSGVSRQQSQCEGATEVTFRRLPPDEAFVPPDCDDTVIRGLVAKNFRVLEDGVEQEPQDVTFEAMHHIDARDNLGDHMEWSETPAGKWSTVETPPGIVRGPTLYLYRVAYRPTQSAEGSCHRVEVKVDRPDAFVYARSQYCRVQHAPRDPLNRTPFGQHLESKASSGKQGKLGLSLQAAFFLPNPTFPPFRLGFVFL